MSDFHYFFVLLAIKHCIHWWYSIGYTPTAVIISYNEVQASSRSLFIHIVVSVLFPRQWNTFVSHSCLPKFLTGTLIPWEDSLRSTRQVSAPQAKLMCQAFVLKTQLHNTELASPTILIQSFSAGRPQRDICRFSIQAKYLAMLSLEQKGRLRVGNTSPVCSEQSPS